MEQGYFFIGDVLGFKNIIQNSKDSFLDGKVDGWLRLVDEATEISKSRIKPQLISDTVFCKASADRAGLRSLISFARHLLNEGIRQSILVRGAITYGPYNWGRLTYGKAVIAAHELEMAQDWIGVACSELPDQDSCWGNDGLVCYPAPFKAGSIKLHPCVVWDVPSDDELVKASTAFPLTRAGEELQNPWRQRLRNTATFGSYVRGLTVGELWGTYRGPVL
jgi:hypothetical protein